METNVSSDSTPETPMKSGALLTTAELMLIAALRDNDFNGAMAALAEISQSAPKPAPVTPVPELQKHAISLRLTANSPVSCSA